MIQSVKGKVSRSAKNSAHGSLFCIVHFFYTVLVLIRYQATDSSIRWIALLGFAILCDVFLFFGLAEMVGVFYYGSRLYR